MTTEGGSALPKATLEELSATDAWRALGPKLRRLLTIALPQRNLPAAIQAMYGVVPSLATEMAERLLGEDSNVRHVVELYGTGVTAKPATSPASPVEVSAETVIPASVAIDAGTFSN